MKENIKPNLRFPGFLDSWHSESLKNIFQIFNGYAFPSSTSVPSGVRWVKIADVGILEMKKDNLSYLPENYKLSHGKFILNKGDIVVALTRPILGGKLKIAKIDEFFDGSLLNQRVGKLISKNDLNFVYYCLQHDSLIQNIENSIAGTDPPNLSPNEIGSLTMHLPSKEEQQKIASFLSIVDEKIQLLKTQQTHLEQYKKGVMQKIFSRELRFKDENGKDFPEWKDRFFNDILHEHGLKSSGNEEVFSVSVHKGLINQIEHLGRSFSAKDTSNYNRVLPGDIVYTKSPTGNFPFGIVKQSRIKDSVIVSPLYGVFTPESYWMGYILNVYFESVENTHNYLSPIIQKGAKNTINITNTTFLSRSLILPTSIEEQQKIASFLITIDAKIDQCKEQLRLTEEWKKGLLQQMFV